MKQNKRKEVVEYSEDLRKELIPFINKETNLIAEFVKYSFKTDSTDFERMFEKTILFKNIRNESDVILAEHMWLDSTKFDKCLGELEEGIVVSFNAIPKYYKKLNSKTEDSIKYNINIGLTKIKNIKKCRQ